MSEPSSFHSPRPIDFNCCRSRIAELRNVDEDSELGAEEAEKLLSDVALELERKITWISPEWVSNLSSLSSEDIDEILGQLKQELEEVDVENIAIEHEIEEGQRRCMEDYDKLDTEMEKLCCTLESIESQSEGAKENAQINVSCLVNDRADSKFKILELSHQIEKKKTTLKSLEDLDDFFRRFEVVEKIEEAFTGLKVIAIEANNIRLSLKTCIPYLETVLPKQDIENILEPLEMNHELMIETVDATWEVKNAEIFPNDVYIGDIVDSAKSFRQLCSPFSVSEARSSLECLVRRVQARIAVSSLRQFIVKNMNKSRHSFEYLGREDTIVAHVASGIDAFIKFPQGWPISDLPLELISLKSTSRYSKETSLSFHCKVKEMANSLNASARHNIGKFAHSIEDILLQQMREDLQSDLSSS